MRVEAPAAGASGAGVSAAAALAEPTRRATPVLLGTMALCNLGVMLAFYAPLQNLLPRLSESVAGAGGKESALAVITGVGVIGSVIGQPLTGALSDRTTSAWGRRRPWLLGGALAGAAAVALMPYLSSVAAITLLWLVAQFTINAAFAALTATIPDQVPVAQRGIASGLMGLAQTVGIVAGVAAVSFAVTSLQGGFAVTAVLLVLLTVPLLLVLRDPRLRPADRPPVRRSEFVRGFWVSPRLHPDFAWAWAARFAVQLGNAVGTVYLLFFLKDRIGLSETGAEQAQTLVIGLYALGSILTAVAGGYVSDRSGRRKRYVVVSTVVMAVAAILLAAVTSLPMVYAAGFLLGAGYGWYQGVDQALVTQVLPGARDRARDLGVINIANSAPQVIAPVIAYLCVIHLGGYPTLYLVTGAVTLLGAWAIRPIRSVR
jgi:MFS family permease